MKVEYSILIPTWNNLELLKNCVASIRNHSKRSFQIFVFVNEGKDGTEDWLKEEGIDYLASDQNEGICIAMNKLRALSTAPVLCYLNDDMYVLPNWDEYVLSEINSLANESYFISSTMIEPNAPGNLCSINGDFGRDLKEFAETELLNEQEDFEFQDWSGSSWPPLWISAVTWDVIGGFSEEFSPGMYSDPDMAMKAWTKGVRYFKGIGKSRVYHFGSKSTKRSGMNEGRKTFISKWGITSRYFYKYYLKMGNEFSGQLGDPSHPILGKLINKIKSFIN
jgi:glycosyltransferase involved in cell wall biosynthesis